MNKEDFSIGHVEWMSKCFLFFLLNILIIYGCTGQKSKQTASQYGFQFHDRAFFIRSISTPEKSQSYNELVGEDFIATDLNRDQIIDQIVIGKLSLNEAQKIYEYGLKKAANEGKLHIQIPNGNRYEYEKDGLHLEITSFHPPGSGPFNEFKIVNRRQIVSPQITLTIDQNADGILDEMLRGTYTLEEVQSRYTEMIETGLQKNKITRVDNLILVKQK